MLTVRDAALTDTPAVMDLLGRVWEDDYVPHAWSEWMRESRDIKLVAVLDGKLVGLCHVGHVSDDECWFSGMRVDPAFHRRGIGTALTKAAIKAAESRGFERALLGIDAENTASLEMTARAGFVRIADYLKLTGQTGQSVTGPRLRAAESADVPRLLAVAEETAKRDGIPAAAYWGWEWSSLTAEALAKMAASGECYVVDGRPVEAYLPASVGDDIDVFNPYGPVPAVVELVRGLMALMSERSLPVCLFVPVNSPYIEPLAELGLCPVAGEGYTIWRLDLGSHAFPQD